MLRHVVDWKRAGIDSVEQRVRSGQVGDAITTWTTGAFLPRRVTNGRLIGAFVGKDAD